MTRTLSAPGQAKRLALIVAITLTVPVGVIRATWPVSHVTIMSKLKFVPKWSKVIPLWLPPHPGIVANSETLLPSGANYRPH